MRKVCSRCRVEKDVEEFGVCRRTKDGRLCYCKKCYKQYRAEYAARNRDMYRRSTAKYRAKYPERVKKVQSRYRARNADRLKYYWKEWKYGVSMGDFEQMFMATGGSCYICGLAMKRFGQGSNAACIDHDHKSGFVRGLLCNNCNSGLGHFEDMVDRLYAAIKYLMNAKRKQQAC